jgi:hypothetical protein
MLKLRSAVVLAGALMVAQAMTMSAAAPGTLRETFRAAPYDHMIGTFRLDPARSEDPRRVADAALLRLPSADRDRVMRLLEDRLDPPEAISIDRQDNRVIIASSRGPRVEFDADGRTHNETTSSGRTLTTRASVSGDLLEVNATGNAGGGFSVSFAPLDNGQALRVTRRLFDEALRQPITIESVYRKTSDVPEWNVYDPNRRDLPENDPSLRTSVVPAGTTLTATLDKPVDLRNIRRGDLVTLVVHDASRRDLDGATIEGFVTNTPSTTDRIALSLDFDRIRLRNGRTADFDGTIERVRGPNGDDYSVDRSDPSRDRKDEAVTRGTVGAAVGAIIGAVAGGLKGAAIGAVIGGAGGAGTVLIDNSSNRTELPRGTEFTIRAQG